MVGVAEMSALAESSGGPHETVPVENNAAGKQSSQRVCGAALTGTRCTDHVHDHSRDGSQAGVQRHARDASLAVLSWIGFRTA